MNKKIIFVFIAVSLFLIGCNGKPSDRPITDIDVRKGVDGLTMEFVQNAPPDRVFEEGILPIAIELGNKGASNIEEDKGILVFGFEKAYVDFVEDSEKCLREVCKFDIEGKSVYSPVGDEEFVTTNARAKKIGVQSETHRSTILATACYPYKTIFGSSVCIDPDVYGMIKGQKACSAQELVFKSQGAPVAVTKIESRMLPQSGDKVKPHFIIYIENKGNGEVISFDKVEDACSSKGLDYTDFNTLKINATLSGIALECSGEAIDGEPDSTLVRLRDKEDMVRCTYEASGGIDARDAYTAALEIEMDYGYTFTISKDIIIEKILTY